MALGSFRVLFFFAHIDVVDVWAMFLKRRYYLATVHSPNNCAAIPLLLVVFLITNWIEAG